MNVQGPYLIFPGDAEAMLSPKVAKGIVAYSTPLHWAWYALPGSLVTLLAGKLVQIFQERGDE